MRTVKATKPLTNKKEEPVVEKPVQETLTTAEYADILALIGRAQINAGNEADVVVGLKAKLHRLLRSSQERDAELANKNIQKEIDSRKH